MQQAEEEMRDLQMAAEHMRLTEANAEQITETARENLSNLRAKCKF